MKASPIILNADEKKAAYSLSMIYSLRMLGLFMILPVFSLYAKDLSGSTPLLIGLAIGAYGLTQAIFQIPFGMISDKLGRKPMIILGMLIFALGSLVAGMSESIYGVIAGRLLQGSGAVAAVLMAMAADLTREEHRMKVMATIGVSIGLSFAVAMVAGSVLESVIGVNGIFYLTACLAIMGVFIVIYVVPDVKEVKCHRDTETIVENLGSILKNKQLLRLDLGIFILHMVLTATFLVIPMVLVDPQYVNIAIKDHWMIYLPVMLFSMLFMVPFIILAESRRKMKAVFIGAILTMILAELGFWNTYQSVYGLVASLLVFFTAFNLLEASLPSLVAKISPAENKGTAMGIYSTSQFLGAFCGGVAGGQLLGLYGIGSVFLFSAGCFVVWFFIALTMKNPRFLSNYIVKVTNITEQQRLFLSRELTEINGVAEAMVIVEDGEAFLKVDLHALDTKALMEISERYSELKKV
ncbi:MAG: MFS transporter [Pseudomonadota bacterium]